VKPSITLQVRVFHSLYAAPSVVLAVVREPVARLLSEFSFPPATREALRAATRPLTFPTDALASAAVRHASASQRRDWQTAFLAGRRSRYPSATDEKTFCTPSAASPAYPATRADLARLEAAVAAGSLVLGPLDRHAETLRRLARRFGWPTKALDAYRRPGGDLALGRVLRGDAASSPTLQKMIEDLRLSEFGRRRTLPYRDDPVSTDYPRRSRGRPPRPVSAAYPRLLRRYDGTPRDRIVATNPKLGGDANDAAIRLDELPNATVSWLRGLHPLDAALLRVAQASLDAPTKAPPKRRSGRLQRDTKTGMMRPRRRRGRGGRRLS